MNRPPDVDLVLRTYLADTGDRAPDRVLEDVAARIARQPRRGWRLQRRPFMNTYAKLAAAAAAVLVVGIVGWQLLPAIGGFGGRPTGVPSTPPTAAPTGTPAAPTGTAGEPVALPEGRLPAGAYRIQPFVPERSNMAVVADVPADWMGHPSVPALTKPDENTGILIAGMIVDSVFSDPCHWDLAGTGSPDQPGDVAVGPTVDDLVAALKANKSYTSSTERPITIGGYEGQQLELQLPSFNAISTCDIREGQSAGDYFVFPRGFWALSTDTRWRLYILDVEGTRLVTLMSIAPSAPAADVAEAADIVESFEITP